MAPWSAGGDPAKEALYITDASMWTGGRNNVLSGDGQFPYDRASFGSLTQLAHLTIAITPTTRSRAVTGYQRALDISNGLLTTSYVHQAVTYRREVYASQPDDVVVLSFTQSGGGTYSGRTSFPAHMGSPSPRTPPTARPPSVLPSRRPRATALLSLPSVVPGRCR